MIIGLTLVPGTFAFRWVVPIIAAYLGVNLVFASILYIALVFSIFGLAIRFILWKGGKPPSMVASTAQAREESMERLKKVLRTKFLMLLLVLALFLISQWLLR